MKITIVLFLEAVLVAVMVLFGTMPESGTSKLFVFTVPLAWIAIFYLILNKVEEIGTICLKYSYPLKGVRISMAVKEMFVLIGLLFFLLAIFEELKIVPQGIMLDTAGFFWILAGSIHFLFETALCFFSKIGEEMKEIHEEKYKKLSQVLKPLNK